jgi:hypothetical protein
MLAVNGGILSLSNTSALKSAVLVYLNIYPLHMGAVLESLSI